MVVRDSIIYSGNFILAIKRLLVQVEMLTRDKMTKTVLKAAQSVDRLL